MVKDVDSQAGRAIRCQAPADVVGQADGGDQDQHAGQPVALLQVPHTAKKFLLQNHRIGMGDDLQADTSRTPVSTGADPLSTQQDSSLSIQRRLVEALVPFL